MSRRRVVLFVLALFLAVSVIGTQAASAYTYSGSHLANDKASNIAYKLYNILQEKTVKKNFNATLSAKVHKGKVDLTTGLVNTSGKKQTVSITDKPYDIYVYNAKGNVVWYQNAEQSSRKLKEITLKTGQNKEFKKKAKDTWDMKDISTGKYVTEGKYKVKVVWHLTIGGRKYDVSVEKSFTIHKKDIPASGKNPTPTPSPEVHNDVYVELDTVKKDGRLQMNFALVNDTPSDLTFGFGSGQQYEIIIYDANKNPVYHWSYGKYFTMALINKQLKKGGKLSYQEEWNYTDDNGKKVAAGTYYVQVIMLPYEYTKISGIDYDFVTDLKKITLTDADLKNKVDTTLNVRNENGRLWLDFALVNNSANDVTLSFRNGQKYDIIITKNGQEVYRWSYGRMFIQMLSDVTIKKGEAYKVSEAWDFVNNDGVKVSPGTYKAKVVFVPAEYAGTDYSYYVLSAEKDITVTNDDVKYDIDTVFDTRIENGRLKLDIALRNRTARDVLLKYGSSRRFNIIVTNSLNSEVYNLDENTMYASVLTDDLLKAGSVTKYYAEWDLKDKTGKTVNSGDYKVEVKFVPYGYETVTPIPSTLQNNLSASRIVEIPGTVVNKNTAVVIRPEIANGSMKIPFSLVNLTQGSIELIFTTGQKYDIKIRNQYGYEVYTLPSKFYTQALSFVTLEKGKTLDYEFVWDMKDKYGIPVPEGNYTIEARITAFVPNITDYNYNELIGTKTVFVDR